MAEPSTRLLLVSPLVDDADALAPILAAACAEGHVAALLLRLPAADERTLINQVKVLVPAPQAAGTAVIVAAAPDADLATIAARGGADGVHVTADLPQVRELRERLKGDRILGVGGLRTKHDAMTMGEAGADYLLFGEPRPDGSMPPLEASAERAAWWAEIFETPCAAYAPTLTEVGRFAATGAEFVALGDAVWTYPEGPAAAVEVALRALRASESPG